MENCRVAPYAGIIERGACIDLGSAVEEQSRRCDIAEFRGHMQKTSPLEREASAAAHTEIEFRKTPVYESGISVNLLSEAVQPVAEQREERGDTVLGFGSSLEKEIDTGAQSFYGTRVTRNKVVESPAW